MKVFAQPGGFSTPPAGACLAIGVFDGVHVGHQELFRQLLVAARGGGAAAVAVTFDRHPNAIVAPPRVPLALQTLDQRLRSIAATGVDGVWLIPFDEAFSRRTGEQFVRGFVRDFGRVGAVLVGDRFQFGHQRSGNVGLLRRLGPELGFAVRALAAEQRDGRDISSTRIREAIQAGDFALATRLLGRPWRLGGPVVRGEQLGRQLGFPTANLDVPGLVLPPPGVYVAPAWLDNERHAAVVNVGLRPTLAQPDPQLRVEAHFLDGEFELYGRALELEFMEQLRGEQRFASLTELKEQIARDVVAARKRLAAAR